MNNPALYNAALAGTLAGINQRWSTATDPAAYAPIVDAASAFATEVDSKIAFDPAMNVAKADILDGICNGYLEDRSLVSTTPSDYSQPASAIAAIYEEAVGSLEPDGQSYDYIVIGAGTSGAPYAKFMTDDLTTSVLVIEGGANYSADPLVLAAGGGTAPDFLNNTKYHWNHVGIPGNAPVLPTPFTYTDGRGWGGGSMHNFQLAVRGAPETYNQWAVDAGNARWTYNNLLPIMKYLELFVPDGYAADLAQRGDSGPLGIVSIDAPLDPGNNFVAAFAAQATSPVANDYNDPTTGTLVQAAAQLFVDPFTFNRSWAASAFLDSSVVNPDGTGVGGRLLSIQSQCIVDKILFDTSGTTPKAIGVTYTDANGNGIKAYAKKGVRVCAGSINTAAILQRSGIGPAALLADLGITPIKVNENVGQNMQCHYGPVILLAVDLAHLPPAPFGPYCAFSDISGANVGPGTGAREVQWLGFNAVAKSGIPFSGALQNALGITEGEPVFIFNAWMLKPAKNGEVSITSTDPTVEAEVQFHFFEDPDDRANAVKIFKMAANIAQAYTTSNPLYPPNADYPAPFGPAPDDAALENDAEWAISFTNHASGTCKMGTDDTVGVVDADLNVFGVENLACCDCSVQPEISSGNTSYPAYILGMIKAQIDGATVPWAP